MSWDLTAASSQYFVRTTTFPLEPPFWVSAWVNWDTGDSTIFSTANSGSSVDYHYVYIRSFNNCGIGSRDSVANASVNTSTTVTAGTWANVIGAWESAASRKVWLNNGGQGTNTTSVSPAGLNNVAVGVVNRSGPFWYFDGRLAEVVLGRGILNHADRASLRAGFDPRFLSPEVEVLAYWKLHERGDLTDHWGNRRGLTRVNGPVHHVSHPVIQEWPQDSPLDMSKDLPVPGLPKRYVARAL